jgi:WD40 repeat protein
MQKIQAVSIFIVLAVILGGVQRPQSTSTALGQRAFAYEIVAWSLDGNFIAIMDVNNNLTVQDRDQQTVAQVALPDSLIVAEVLWNAQGDAILISTSSRVFNENPIFIWYWQANIMTELDLIRRHSTRVVWLGNNYEIVTNNHDNLIRLDGHTGEEIYRTDIVRDSYDIANIAYCSSGYLIINDTLGEMRILDAENFSPLKSIDISEAGTPADITCDPSGQYFATSGLNSLNIWDVASGSMIRTLDNLGYNLGRIIWANQFMLVASSEGIIILDTNTWEPIFTLQTEDRFTSMSWNAQYQELAYTTMDATTFQALGWQIIAPFAPITPQSQ